jgi:hypothetical protein
MTTVTINIAENLVRDAKTAAARLDQSLGAFIAALVARTLGANDADSGSRQYSPEYERAMHEALAETPYLRTDPSRPFVRRDELYDRAVQRRAEAEASSAARRRERH